MIMIREYESRIYRYVVQMINEPGFAGVRSALRQIGREMPQTVHANAMDHMRIAPP